MSVHHIEIWVSELHNDLREWGWLLSRVGYTRTARWDDGETWDDGSGPYLTLTTSPNIVGTEHDRRRPGVNHLAFRGGSRSDVDAIVAAAAGNGWTPLYHERYPHAGGPNHYAGWLENTSGFKAEIVAAQPTPSLVE